MPKPAGPASGSVLCGTLSRLAIAAAVVCGLTSPGSASADADRFRLAINYVFTGRIDPPNAPDIVDRAACVVVVPDPKFKRYIRYYVGRFEMDEALFNKKYSGSRVDYALDVKGDDIIIEYLGPDKQTVLHSHRSAQIPLPGDIDQTRKALQIVADQCKPKKSNTPF